MENTPLLVSVPTAAKLIGLGRTRIYELLDSGDLRSVRIGRRRLIRRDSIDEFVDRVSSEAA